MAKYTDRFLELLEKARMAGAFKEFDILERLETDPKFERFRKLPAFQKLARKIAEEK